MSAGTKAGALGFVAAVLAFSGVALGAFGAHALDAGFSPEAKDWWDTATLYLLLHAAFVVAMARNAGGLRRGCWALAIGAAIFAGTLYAMALGGPRWLGAITPIGGVCLLAGWAMAALGALRD